MTITVNSITKLIECNDARINVPARLSNGEWRYLYNGRWIDQDAFDILFPVAVYVNPGKHKGENACKKLNFIKGQKSY